MERSAVETLVTRFLTEKARSAAKWSDPDECAGLCDDASDALICWLSSRGIEAEYATERRTTTGRSAAHTVVTVGEWTIDLTARQYDADADFPSIY